MKKLVWMLMAVLLFLTACSSEDVPEYTNIQLNFGSFQLGDTVCHRAATGFFRYHADVSNVMDHFCYDPLCDHSGEDGVCPDCYNFDWNAYVTDGVRIYANVRSYLSALNGGTWNRLEHCIYSFLPDGSDMKLHCTYESTNGGQPNLSYRDGYIYFYQSFYEDEYDPTQTGSQDQYMKLMRLNTQNNELEAALPQKFSNDNRIYLDDQNYYILSVRGSLDVYDRVTNVLVAESVLPDGCAVSYVTDYRGETYFICKESRETREYTSTIVLATYSLYRYNEGKCDKLIGGIGDLTGIQFADGAIWYAPFEFTYIGVKECPTGVGNETAPLDFYRLTDGTLARYDIASGVTDKWELATHDDGDEIHFYGLSDGSAIIELMNTQKKFDDVSYDAGIYAVEFGEDGILRLSDKKEFSCADSGM